MPKHFIQSKADPQNVAGKLNEVLEAGAKDVKYITGMQVVNSVSMPEFQIIMEAEFETEEQKAAFIEASKAPIKPVGVIL